MTHQSLRSFKYDLQFNLKSKGVGMVHEILMAEMVLSTRDLRINFSTGWCLNISQSHDYFRTFLPQIPVAFKFFSFLLQHTVFKIHSLGSIMDGFGSHPLVSILNASREGPRSVTRSPLDWQFTPKSVTSATALQIWYRKRMSHVDRQTFQLLYRSENYCGDVKGRNYPLLGYEK